MGIRFYCPNGHRLNVKDFLAGKRGICPHCDAHFRIPRESEIPQGSPRAKPGSAAAADPKRRTGKRRKPAGNGPAKAVETVAATTRTKSLTTTPGPASDPVDVNVRATDPISEAPDAVWYVRPPSGGQYGPAKGDVLRKWIVEGRVSSDSLVWREGWEDWKAAGPVFPELGDAEGRTPELAGSSGDYSLPMPSAPLDSSAPSANLTAPTRSGVSRPSSAHRKRKPLAAVIVLLVLIAVLFTGLVIVLSTRP